MPNVNGQGSESDVSVAQQSSSDREPAAGRVFKAVRGDVVTQSFEMAMYLSLVLSGELVAMEGHVHEASVALELLWGTATGLTLVHIFAFDVATRAFGRPLSLRGMRVGMLMQFAAALVIALLVTLPFLVFDVERAVEVAGFVSPLFVGVTGFAIGRLAGRSVLTSILIGGVLLVLGEVLVALKVTLTH